MAIYRGVDNVARKVTKQYRGIDNVARKISKEYRGVDNVARLVFGGDYKITTNIDNEALYSNYTFDIEGDVIGITVTNDGGSNAPSNGGVIQILISGDLGGKDISFDYTPVGYNIYNRTIYYMESISSGYVESTKTYLKTNGSYSGRIIDDAMRIQFTIWTANDLYGSGSVQISNLKIDGEPIIFEGGKAK
ncbi:MAG: hypothetical protein IJN43_13690 [Ruminococcus sp.]|nr:hypothetical protein [Ruminococcus sp.]